MQDRALAEYAASVMRTDALTVALQLYVDAGDTDCVWFDAMAAELGSRP